MKRGLLIGAVLLSTAALAQVGPSEIWGLVYNAVFPTFTDGQTSALQATSSGQLNVTGLGPSTPCGTGVIDLSAGCTITVMLRLGP
jgi:hypothetical protein